jgi:hypothetical protein
MKEKIKQGLYTIDFLGHKPSLKINSKNRYQTILGGFISIIIILLSLTSIIYFGSELVYKSQPIVVVSRANYEDFPSLNMSAQGFGFYVVLEYSNYTKYIDESIYTLQAEQYSIHDEKDETGIIKSVSNIKQLEISTCDKYYKPEDIPEKNYPVYLSLFYCIKPNSAQIENFWGHPYNSLVRVYIKKCQNSTENNFKCKSKEKKLYIHSLLSSY